MLGEFPTHAQFGFRKPSSDPDNAPYDPKYHTSRGQDTENVAS